MTKKELETQVRVKTEVNNKLQNQINELTALIKTKDDTIFHLESKVKAKELDCNNLIKVKDKEIKSLSGYKEEYLGLHKVYDKLKSDYEESVKTKDKEIESLDNNLRSKSNLITKLKQSVSDAADLTNRLTKDLDEANSKYNDLIETNNSNVLANIKAQDTLKSDYEESIKTREEAYDKLNNKYLACKLHLDDVQAKYDKLHSESELLVESSKKLKHSHEELHKIFDYNTVVYDKLKSDNAKLQASYDNLKAVFNTNKESYGKLFNEHTVLEKAFDGKSKLLDELKAENLELRYENSKLATNLESLTNRYNAMERSNVSACNKVIELTTENENLKGKTRVSNIMSFIFALVSVGVILIAAFYEKG